MTPKQPLLDKLIPIQQEHLLKYWDFLDEPSKERLARQIEALDTSLFIHQRGLLSAHASASMESMGPFVPSSASGFLQDIEAGKRLLSDGKAGCLVVAGGQGTRLRFEGPKGMYPISPVKKKTLFQILAEKILAVSKQVGHAVPLAIMTSPLNHQTTVEFFAGHNNFGLQAGQLCFFMQKMLPFITPEGDVFLEGPDAIACGPDGNGGSLHQFYESGIWKKWFDAGVRHVHYVLIDNPLCDPVDAELLGFHVKHQADVTVKCILREDPSEQVGVLVRKDDHVQVIEYSEIPSEERNAVNVDGSLKHPCANISVFCFAMAFIEKIIPRQLPLHKAFKAAKKEVSPGKFLLSSEPCAWKFERFIFDVLPFAQRIEGLLYNRRVCYAPLKNLSGAGSPEAVQKALIARDRQILQEISGHCTGSGDSLLEIAQDFHYPTPELLLAWKSRKIPQEEYISATKVARPSRP